MKKLLFIIIVLMTGCTQSSFAGMTVTPGKIPTYTPTIQPTLEYTFTKNYTPTLSKTPFVTYTPNPIDTPAGDDPTSKVIFLLDTNAGCTYPCWWGITPGVTSWADAQIFLESFANTVIRGSDSNVLPGLEYAAWLPNPIASRPPFVMLFFTDMDKAKTIEVIQTYLLEDLQSMLKRFGVPDKIWITLQVLGPPNDATFIFYYNKGVMFVYTDKYTIDTSTLLHMD